MNCGRIGIVLVDHGSRSAESNRLVVDAAAQLALEFGQRYDVVEPAHMELAEPTIAQAYRRCVDRGRSEIIVVPFFLGPGKHWQVDIPELVRCAAAEFPATTFTIAEPLGGDELMLRLIAKRADEAVAANLFFTCASSR